MKKSWRFRSFMGRWNSMEAKDSDNDGEFDVRDVMEDFVPVEETITLTITLTQGTTLEEEEEAYEDNEEGIYYNFLTIYILKLDLKLDSLDLLHLIYYKFFKRCDDNMMQNEIIKMKYIFKTLNQNHRRCLTNCIGDRCYTWSHLKQMNHYPSKNWVCGLKPYREPSNRITENVELTMWIAVGKYIVIYKSLRCLSCYINARLTNDIEKNPGPALAEEGNILIITLNCRGLNNLDKLRLTLNEAIRMLNLNPNTILMLQETMITETRYLDLAWRGNYIFTPGTGNSQGCITLLHKEVKITNQLQLNHRGHLAELELSNNLKLTLINIYAPNGYGQEKREYFQNFIRLVENVQTHNIVIGGDFNITMNDSDRFNRQTCAGERNIASNLSSELNRLGLMDCWEGKEGMTWRRGNSMSKLDRIYVNLTDYILADINTDWTLCESDHAAVLTRFRKIDRRVRGPKPCRLNNDVITNKDSLAELRSYICEQLQTIDPETDPHMLLEFAKMTICTKALQLGKRQIKEEENQLQFINNDIVAHERLLSHTKDTNEQNDISLHIQTRVNEKNELLEAQGKRLAWKTKTR